MKRILYTLASMAAALAVAHADPALPYVDSFNNANVTTDDNGTANFWKVIPGSFTSPEQAAESAGEVDLTSATAFGATVAQTNVSSTFNFFAQPLTFTLSGFSMTGTASAANQQFVFAIQDSGSQVYYAPEASIVLSVLGNNTLTLDANQVGSFGSQALISSTSLSSAPTAFALTLDGTNLTYSLVVTEASGSQTFSGSLPSTLTPTLWGPNGNKGASAISFGVFDNQAPAVQGVPDSDVSARIGEVSVTAVPEPSTWAMMMAGGSLLLASQRLRRRR